MTGKYTDCNSQAMICQCCNDVVSTMTAMGDIPLNGTTLLLGVEEYSVVQLSASYPSYFEAAANESETKYAQAAADACCPKLLAHVVSPIRCVWSPAFNSLTSDVVASVDYECLIDSEAQAAAYDWKGGCTEQQFERKVIVGPCCVYPDGDGVPDSYKQSWSAANSSSLLRCWQSYNVTTTDYYNGESWTWTDCGVTYTDRCGAFTGTYYSCDYYNSDEGTLVPVDMGTTDLWTVLYAQVAISCANYSCQGDPEVWTDSYHGWCYAITCCKNCNGSTVITSNYEILSAQSEECYSCGDTCRWYCGDSQTSCYDWLNNCESYGGCPSECPESCGFEDSSSSAT